MNCLISSTPVIKEQLFTHLYLKRKEHTIDFTSRAFNFAFKERRGREKAGKENPSKVDFNSSEVFLSAVLMAFCVMYISNFKGSHCGSAESVPAYYGNYLNGEDGGGGECKLH